jgi:hypothetical protein
MATAGRSSKEGFPFWLLAQLMACTSILDILWSVVAHVAAGST